MSATIILKNLRVPAKIGVYDHEKQAPQLLKLDLSLGLRHQSASLSDRLHETVDYDQIIEFIKQYALGAHHELLESLTYELAQRLLANFPLKNCEITAWKSIAAHAPTEIAVKVSMQAGERWSEDLHRHGLSDEDRCND